LSLRPLVTTLAALLAAPALLTASASAQSGGLKSVIDDGLAELARRQAPDGSFGDIVTTCDAVLAFCESPRRYRESDGPFVRKAIAWLVAQVGPDGRPAVSAELGDEERRAEEVATAAWIEDALRFSRVEAARDASESLAAFRTRSAAEGTTPIHRRNSDWTRSFTFSAPVERLEQELSPMTQVLFSDRGTFGADQQRWLHVTPSVLRGIAAQAPDLKLQTTAGERLHWSDLLAQMVLRYTSAPAGFEELPARDVAAAARALTICLEHAPKVASGAAGGPPKPTGTRRVVGEDLAAAWRDAAASALAYLASQQKDGRFGFMGREDAGITALALSATQRTCKRLGIPPPVHVAAGLDWLCSMQKPNGSIHSGGLAVYTTSAAVMALTDAARPQDRAVVERAALFLKVVQRDEGEGYDRDQDWGYGGIGYGNELRPDLSNTQFGVEAMKLAGVPADDEAMQRAILFLQRCQNSPEFNPVPIERADGRVVVAGQDGGAGYHPGESKAGLVDRGDGTFVSRSYGSMTYALLKCYLFAGVPLDDGRVQAALRWIAANWTVELNPGFDPASAQGAEYQGLFYYWFTMAKALDASPLDILVTPDGKAHAWRDELLRKLLEISFREGFWTNDQSSRWMEEFPVLATSYALSAMDHCLPRAE
jgi:squalene-hopene/tetraprenyl-beta-curcumene cyclase